MMTGVAQPAWTSGWAHAFHSTHDKYHKVHDPWSGDVVRVEGLPKNPGTITSQWEISKLRQIRCYLISRFRLGTSHMMELGVA